MAKAIPDGYHTVTASLTLKDAAAAIDFYQRAFGARETMRVNSPDGKIMHAEIQVGDSRRALPEAISVAPHSCWVLVPCSRSCNCGELAMVSAARKAMTTLMPIPARAFICRRDSIGVN